jgi:hypothetical protein
MKRWLLTLFCLLAPAAMGASSLEALRAQASAARVSVNQTRGEQMKDQAELNALGTRIERLKAQAKGKLLPGSELDEALKRSQELSGALTSLAGTISSKETELETANLSLLSALSDSLASLRAQFDRQTDREARKVLIAKMRDLRHERETVRAMLPPAKLPALDGLKDSDDPEDLLEQADLVKDNEDKVRNQLRTLEKRIAEAKAERDLDSRVRQFMGDDALFDEQDRRLRLHRESVEAAASPSTSRVTAGPDSTKTAADGFTQNPSAIPPGSGGANPNGSSFDSQPTPTPGGAPAVRTSNAADARPVVGSDHVAGHGDDDDLEDLEIQRAKLKGLAEELKARADALQKKAAQLR